MKGNEDQPGFDVPNQRPFDHQAGPEFHKYPAVDRERAHALHASGYLVKPPSFQQQAAALAQEWGAGRTLH